MADENVIEHYGVKGMKWGVITQKFKGAGPSSTAKKAAKLSDDDLRQKVNRLNMEKQYVDLTNSKNARERSSVSKGKSYVSGLVADNADHAVRRASKNVVNMVVDKYTKG